MAQPLLQTKLLLPRPRPGTVCRPRLVSRLDALPQYRLTLVSAPAGFGKTTLLAEWAAQTKLPNGWVSFNESDDDPASFLAYIAAALDGIHAGLGAEAVDMLHSAQPVPIPTVLVTLLNQIQTIRTPFALVLDDLHLLTAPAVYEALTFLLEHQPPELHLVIATRVDPPIPLARWRARGELLELRAEDLRFGQAEAGEFLNGAMGLVLAADQVDSLARRTEGWIAGLQMAALALRAQLVHADHDGVPDFIQAFSGSHRYIFDYLLGEVFAQQPARVQQFLLQTSILDRLCGPLCDAVTRSADGATLLEQLEKANLFLVPLDAERQWYRYHHLFAELLRHRFTRATPGWIQEHGTLTMLHKRAAEWYAGEGLIPEAIRHSIAAEDYAGAASLIESVGERMWMNGQFSTLRGWLQGLPDTVCNAHPRLAIWEGWITAMNGWWQEMPARDVKLCELQSVLSAQFESPAVSTTAAPDQPFARDLYGMVCAVRSVFASMTDRHAAALILSREALQNLSEQNQLWRGIAAFSLGHVYEVRGEPEPAIAAYTQARDASRAAGNHHLALRATIYLGIEYLRQGRLRLCEQTCRAVVEEAERRGGALPLTLSSAHVFIAQVAYRRNRLEEAEAGFQRAMELGQAWGNVGVQFLGYQGLPRVKAARRDFDGALAALSRAETLARDGGMAPHFVQEIILARARLFLDRGDLASALLLAAAVPSDLPSECNYADVPRILFLARLWAMQGRHADALQALALLQARLEASGCIDDLLDVLATQALICHAMGDSASAQRALRRVLVLAEPEENLRLFLDEGLVMLELVRGAATRGVMPEFSQKLLAAFEQERETRTLTAGSSSDLGLVEPLTPREREVLSLIAVGQTNAEIAEGLYLTVNTVKVHIKNIYGKLLVKNRTQAIHRAQELHLLASASESSGRKTTPSE